MARRRSKPSMGAWVIVGLLILVLAQCMQARDDQFAPSPSAGAPVTPRPDAEPALSTRQSPLPSPSPAPLTVREVRYVTADALNVRPEPNTSGGLITSLPRGTLVEVLDIRSGWLLIRLSGNGQGWVSGQYTSSNRPAPVYAPPAPISRPAQASSSGLSCSPRRTCGQIGSCSAAQWYRRNCSWGGRLDRDNDGLACETLC